MADSRLEWREILCETNTTPGLVSRLQQALNKEGYKAGKVDGVLGSQTMAAVQSYQRDKKMPSGQLTLSVLDLRLSTWRLESSRGPSCSRQSAAHAPNVWSHG